jgi:aryl-alcohol dehydrogenase-like predicted oxidoreductase
MEQREIGHSGLKVSVIGLGCNNFGWLIDEGESRPVIARALDAGINFFDTADIYGESEVVLGNALGAHRKQVVIATKFGYPGPGVAGGASPDYVIQAAERSLKRLKTDYIDLLYLHAPDPQTPIADTLGAMDRLVRAGKARFIAASNMSSGVLEKADAAAKSGKLQGFVASQEEFNLLKRGAASALAPTLERLGMSLIPYFPLASGLLTGKYQRGAEPAAGTRFDKWKNMSSQLTEDNFRTIDRLQDYASAHQHSLSQLAIAWLLAKPYVPSVIAGSTKVGQLEDNLRATDWKLTPSQSAAIEELAAA